MADVPQEEPKLNGTEPPPTTVAKEDENVSHSPPPTQYHRGNSDPDAQDMVISSLRTQVQDLFSQVSQLNNKLVNSYDRVSDLEDELHVTSAGLRNSSLKISQLELERTQHLSALNTGLLVEKSHVTTELNRLMEKATEEAAQRGQAESARMAIEKELDDLSASLFGQANTMVAEARYEKYLSERKVEEAEKTLKGAEEAVQLMQTQMQALQADKEEAERKVEDMEVLMGKGKWLERTDTNTSIPTRFLSTHTAYQDYLAFVAHLRVLRPTSLQPPAMSTLLPLPFLARLLNEDSEPTVRLDLAPSLNWLSRRSVLAAIHSGQLTIEPVPALSLFAETNTHPASTTIAGMNSSGDNISCALCGTSIFPTPEHSHPSRSQTVSLGGAYGHPSSWSGSFFKKSASLGSNLNSQLGSPTRSPATTSIGSQLNAQVFIFRLESAPSSAISALPIPSLTKSSSQTSPSMVPQQQSGSYHGSSTPSHNGSLSTQSTTIYLLCTSGWCLSRLRATCTLWAFIRTGVVDKIWEEDVALPPPPPTIPTHINGEKPPVPPRKRGIWGIASAIGEKAASWSDNDKDKRKAPPPPAPHPHERRRVPPPLPPVSAPSQPPASSQPAAQPPVDPSAPPLLPKRASTPPPLPKRNEDRSRNPNPSPPPRTSASTPPPAYNQGVTLPPSPAKGLSLDPAVPLSSIRGPHLQPARAQSPSNVPLPDSRPATPPVLPARAVPPAVGGAPPPLPRRAAARVRVPLGGSRPSTPGNAGEAPPAEKSVAAEATDKAAVEKVGKEHSTDSAGISKSTENSTDPPAVPITTEGRPEAKGVSETEKGAEALPDRSTQDSPGSDDFVDAPTPGDSDQSVATSVAREPMEKVAGGDVEEGTKLDVEDSKAQESDGDSQLTEAPRQTNGDDRSHPSELNGIIEGHVKAEAEDGPAKLEQKTKMGEKSVEGCVGDGTWEERTWKEIVKLREDMFWARIGALRD